MSNTLKLLAEADPEIAKKANEEIINNVVDLPSNLKEELVAKLSTNPETNIRLVEEAKTLANDIKVAKEDLTNTIAFIDNNTNLSTEVKTNLTNELNAILNKIESINNKDAISEIVEEAVKIVGTVNPTIIKESSTDIIKNTPSLNTALQNSLIEKLKDNGNNNFRIIAEAKNLSSDINLTKDKVAEALEIVKLSTTLNEDQKTALTTKLNDALVKVAESETKEAVNENVASAIKVIAEVDVNVAKVASEALVSNINYLPVAIQKDLISKLTTDALANEKVVSEAKTIAADARVAKDKINEAINVVNSKSSLSTIEKTTLVNELKSALTKIEEATNHEIVSNAITEAIDVIGKNDVILAKEASVEIVNNIPELSSEVKAEFTNKILQGLGDNNRLVSEAKTVANEVVIAKEKINDALSAIEKNSELSETDKQKLKTELNKAISTIENSKSKEELSNNVTNASEAISKADPTIAKDLDTAVINNLDVLPTAVKEKLVNKLTNARDTNKNIVNEARIFADGITKLNAILKRLDTDKKLTSADKQKIKSQTNALLSKINSGKYNANNLNADIQQIENEFPKDKNDMSTVVIITLSVLGGLVLASLLTLFSVKLWRKKHRS
ncbi:hypothetical protein ACJA23_01915 [Mycoplasma corogypsi]|uniref:hypothetical protein n=1 Tax=Mycoplasma corogypsi TaxID=2106 RepID=UPI0038733126